MRVKGNVLPEQVDITAYEPIPGKVEVKIRENITPYETVDSMTGETVSGYEYDEYTFIMTDRIGLMKSIKDNLDEWLTTGKDIEFNRQSSIARDMQAALDLLGVNE